MKTIRVFSLLAHLILSCRCTFSQLYSLNPSNTLAFKCANNYLDAYNHKYIEKLTEFFTFYYETPDLERRLNIERSLQKSWGKLECNRIVYDSENEIILLIQAAEMPKS